MKLLPEGAGRRQGAVRPEAMPTDDTPGYPLTLRDSAVHGRGCYAAEPIPAGAFIIEYTGEWVPAEEAYRREADPARPGIYTFWTGDEGAVDGLHGGNAARFINHSCSPNCDYPRARSSSSTTASAPRASGSPAAAAPRSAAGRSTRRRIR